MNQPPLGAPPGAVARAPQSQVYTLTLRRHTGMLIMMRHRTYTVRGTFDQCEAAYKAAQGHNLVAGWWGMFSFFIFNWIAIFGNMSAMSQLRKLAGR